MYRGPLVSELLERDASNFWNHNCEPNCWFINDDKVCVLSLCLFVLALGFNLFLLSVLNNNTNNLYRSPQCAMCILVKSCHTTTAQANRCCPNRLNARNFCVSFLLLLFAIDVHFCRCGAKTCRKAVTNQDYKRPELRAKFGRVRCACFVCSPFVLQHFVSHWLKLIDSEP